MLFQIEKLQKQCGCKALLTQKQKPSVRFFLKLRDLPVYQWEKLWLLPWVFQQSVFKSQPKLSNQFNLRSLFNDLKHLTVTDRSKTGARYIKPTVICYGHPLSCEQRRGLCKYLKSQANSGTKLILLQLQLRPSFGIFCLLEIKQHDAKI